MAPLSRRAPRIPTPPLRWTEKWVGTVEKNPEEGIANRRGWGGGRRGGDPRSTRARQVCRVVDDSASARRLIPECRIRESVSPAPSDRFGQCAKTGLQPSAPECTLSLAGPLIIYPYWTQFTLKLTGSRLVSPAKLTSKLTIYSRSIPLSSLSLTLSFSYPSPIPRLFIPAPLVVSRLFFRVYLPSSPIPRKFRRNETCEAIEREGVLEDRSL